MELGELVSAEPLSEPVKIVAATAMTTSAGFGPQRRALFPHSLIRATGRYQAYFVPSSLTRQVVARLLPRGLETAPQELAPAGQHPVLFVFGKQQEVRPIIQVGKGLEYLEFLLAIPYLQWKNDRLRFRGPLVYLPRLYLDHWLPVLLGWLCGFAKQRARMRSAAEAYRIDRLFDGSPLIQAAFHARGGTGRPRDFLKFAALQDIFVQPLVTATPFGCLCLDFHWKLEEAQMQAADAEVRIEQAFLPGLPLGPFQVDGIDRFPDGAFHLDVPWTLSRPFRPSSIGRMKPGPAARGSFLHRAHLGDRHIHASQSERSKALS
jgi:hypothetical protein